MIQEGLNCLETIDYFFTNIKLAPIIVKHLAAHQNISTSQQPVNEDKVSQQTHPQQPEETRIHPSMLTNRQVPVLNLTDTTITSHTDLQDAFNSANGLSFFLCRMLFALFAGFLASFVVRSLRLFWGMVVRGFARRNLC